MKVPKAPRRRKPRITQDMREHIDLVVFFVRIGDTLTHTQCLGAIEEHIFTGFDGKWLCGRPTADTRRIEKERYGSRCSQWRNDIAPLNVTHINRERVDVLPFLWHLEQAKEDDFPPKENIQ